MKISMSTARKLFIRCQGLDGPWKLPKGKEGVAQVIERLGYVQIDTIAVIQRAHHHTLWSRRPDYTPQMLHELLAQDRRVFEWWGHAASYLPMRDYRYYLPRMRSHAEGGRTHNWLKQNAQLVEEVTERIRKEGPLGSSDFSAPEGKRGPWWSWKPAKQALENLFNIGEVMVTERRNFQRIYDLTERVLPAGIDTTEPDEGEMQRFMVRRALGGGGFASIDGMRWRRRDKTDVPEEIEEMVDSGEIVPLEIKGLDDAQYYALAENVEEAAKRSRKRLHILSPFDSLVINRGRLNRVFGFNYKLECYLPAAKRKHGYFCLPVLWGREFVGRLDPKAERKKKTFIVRRMTFEPGFRDYEGLLPVLAEKLRSFAAFNGCESIVVEQVVPDKAKTPFIREIDSDSLEA
jgi:uncharacterized protein YcaQ